MAQMAEQLLSDIPSALYTAIVIGGGTANQLEYELTVDNLRRQFGERVNVLCIENTGGVADSAIRSSSLHEKSVKGIRANSRALSRELNNITAPLQSELLANERSSESPSQLISRGNATTTVGKGRTSISGF